MYKTFIVGLAALIVGMLVYLHGEISQLRQAEDDGIVVHVEPLANIDGVHNKVIRVVLRSSAETVEVYSPGDYVLQGGVLKKANMASSPMPIIEAPSSEAPPADPPAEAAESSAE